MLEWLRTHTKLPDDVEKHRHALVGGLVATVEGTFGTTAPQPNPLQQTAEGERRSAHDPLSPTETATTVRVQSLQKDTHRRASSTADECTNVYDEQFAVEIASGLGQTCADAIGAARSICVRIAVPTLMHVTRRAVMASARRRRK